MTEERDGTWENPANLGDEAPDWLEHVASANLAYMLDTKCEVPPSLFLPDASGDGGVSTVIEMVPKELWAKVAAVAMLRTGANEFALVSASWSAQVGKEDMGKVAPRDHPERRNILLVTLMRPDEKDCRAWEAEYSLEHTASGDPVVFDIKPFTLMPGDNIASHMLDAFQLKEEMK